jgi:predicted RNase H-like nuclease (RuvC/YqgF family)
MTKQEQIEEMRSNIYYARSKVNGIATSNDIAEALYSIGYRKVPDGAVVLTPEERDEEMKATNEILAERDDLKEKVESLKSEKEGWKMRYSDSGQKNKKLSIKNAQLKAENEQLKAKLEKNPMAIKQKIMEEDDYELTEREQATLFLDRMGSDVEILHDIVENLDELLGKGINDYIMGINGVEGIKDMWERSAVMAFAEKLKKCSYTDNCFTDGKWHRYVLVSDIDELMKEYF